MSDEAEGGRIFFSSTGRSLEGEDEIVVLSVGVDIGSSTSHLVFSRIVLERLDSRYVVATRETFHESDILLTPYTSGETIDAESIILGIVLPGRVSDKVAAAYEEHLFGKATLQDLPDEPRFVINATNVQSGVIWRFMKPYMRDYRVGEVRDPAVPLARAVAASSAFPPVLSPMEMRLDPASFTPGSGLDLQRPPFTTKVILTDGGVYASEYI